MSRLVGFQAPFFYTMGHQVCFLFIYGFDRNQDSDCLIVFIYYYKQCMINFLNQPELNNPQKPSLDFVQKMCIVWLPMVHFQKIFPNKIWRRMLIYV